MKNRLIAHEIWGRELAANEIHVWYASLNKPVLQYYCLLSTDERRRAERFHFEEDKKRFIVRRGILRTILGHYLNVESGRLQFCYGKNGKPALADKFGEAAIRFNMSCSEAIALYAFTSDYEIGVDIERIRDISEMEQIAKRFFSTRENAVFHTLSKSERKEAFFNFWTRKEAFLKATGDGLSRPLNRFDVTLVPGEPARLLRIEGDTEEAQHWSIQDLKPASGFAAALVIKGQIGNVNCWRWAE